MSDCIKGNPQVPLTHSVDYDYDSPGPPFTPKEIAVIDSIKEFLSERELVQARRLETVCFSSVHGRAVGSSIPGLRSFPTDYCLYVQRYDDALYERLTKDFLEAVYQKRPKGSLGGVHEEWYRAITPDGGRHYPLQFHGDLQAWIDCMIDVATEKATTMAWFDKGKFCLTDGRRIPFGDLRIERLEGGKRIPKDW